MEYGMKKSQYLFIYRLILEIYRIQALAYKRIIDLHHFFKHKRQFLFMITIHRKYIYKQPLLALFILISRR